MSNNTILKALERMGYKGGMTGHGFRGIASTVLHEHGRPHEHTELQLAHQERDDMNAAYSHAQYLKQMMQWWSDYLDPEAKKVDRSFGIVTEARHCQMHNLESV